MEKIMIVFVSNVGLLIGKPVLGNSILEALADPRIIMVNQQENKIKLIPLIGNPEEFIIGNSSYSYYEVKDEKIINLYFEKISNITIATKVPSDPITTIVK
jgi:hypothetical protein